MLNHSRTGQQKLAFILGAITVALALLYAWTLTEAAPLAVTVSGERCTAVLEDRKSEIACPGLAGGTAGVYMNRPLLPTLVSLKTLDRLAPPAQWEWVRLRAPAGSREVRALTEPEPGAQRWAPMGGTAVTWPAPDTADYLIEARLRRPDGGHAGILLLEAGSKDGWLFLVESENRQGIWWRWRNGELSEPIVGVPYQKPLVAQSQSLLRQLLATLLGALAIMVTAAALQWVNRRIGRLPKRLPHAREVPGWIALQTNFNPYWLLLPVLLGVFGLTTWIAADALDRIPHVQDSITYLFQAQTLARSALWAPEPPFPEAFEQEFLITYQGKWFGQYPPGYPAMLALGVLMGQPWLVNPLLALLTVALLFTLGKLLYRTAIGLLGAVLALLSPFFIFLSASFMVHAAELFWTTLLMVSWTLALRRPYRLRWALLAGASLGMLLLTRQITATVVAISFVVPMLVATFIVQGQLPWPQGQSNPARQAAGLLVVAPFVLLLLGYQAALTGSPWQDPRLLARPFDRPGFGADIGENENAFDLSRLSNGTAVTWYTDPEEPPRGHSLARGLYNTEKNLGALANHLFGWHPIITFAFCWLAFLLRRPGRADWIFLAVLLAVLAIYVAYWTTGLMYGPRYYYAALPALLLLTARGLQALAERFGKVSAALIFASVAVLALVSYWPDAVASLDGYNFIGGEERSLVEDQLQGQALVFVPVQDWWDYGRFFSGNTPWLDGRIVYARDLGEAQNACLQASYPMRPAYSWHAGTQSVSPLAKSVANCSPVGQQK